MLDDIDVVGIQLNVLAVPGGFHLSSLRTDGISTGKRWRRSVGRGESPFPILRPKWSGSAAMRRTGFLRWCVRSTWPVCWKGCRRVGPWRLRDRRRPTRWLQSQGANLPRWAVFPNSNFRAAWYAFTVCPPHRGPIPNRWPKRRPFTGRCSPKRDLSPERRPVGPTAGIGTSAGSGKPESGRERMPAVRERDVLPYSYFLYFCDSV